MGRGRDVICLRSKFWQLIRQTDQRMDTATDRIALIAFRYAKLFIWEANQVFDRGSDL